MVNMGNVWDRTTEFLSDNARALLPIASVAVLVPETVAALVRGAGPTVNPAVAFTVAIVCLLISFWGQLAIVALALNPGGGRAGAIAKATSRYPHAIGATALVLVVLLALMLPVAAVVGASGIDMTAPTGSASSASANLSGGARTFVTIYFIFWVIVSYVVWARMWLLNPTVIAEGGVVGAIRRAFARGRGIAWRLIGVSLLFVVVAVIAWLAVTMAIGVIVGLFSHDPAPFGIGRIIVSLAGGCVATAFYAIVAAFSANLYREVTGQGARPAA